MIITKIISSSIKNGRRFIKSLGRGKSDVQTSFEAMPFGLDSSPPPGMRGAFLETEDRESKVMVGYINLEQLADVGELRLYSIDSNGDVVSTIHLKKDGTIEFNGNGDNLVRFSELKTAYESLQQTVNDMRAEIAAFASAYVPGGPAVQGTPPSFSFTTGANTGDIDPAKIDELKTP